MTESEYVDVRLLRSFLVVAQELSFTRAAKRLFLTQQAVSARVRALESVLRVQLFDRTTRQVRLTRAGEVLRDQVNPALRNLDRAISTVRRVSGQGEALLLVGHTPSVAHRLLPLTVAVLQRLDPNLEVRSMECSEETLRPAVLDGRVDIGIGFEIGMAGPGLSEVLVAREPWCVVICPDHPLASRQSVSPMDLAPYEWLCWPRSTHPGFWNAVHTLATSLGTAVSLRETWLTIAHARICREGAVMLQPASYAAQLPRGLTSRDLEGSPQGAYSAVWDPRGAPVARNLMLEALCQAASRLDHAEAPLFPPGSQLS
ncbi:LysR family transcriptional regulator [Streptomyces puniciscabiei]